MRNVARALLAGLLMMSVVAPLSAKNGKAADKPVAQVTTGDFAWFTGRWIGHLKNGKLTAEQICSRPDKGEMLCLFRIQDGQKYIMYELNTLFDTPDGPELRSLDFNPTLEGKEVRKPQVMKLTKYSDAEVVFEGTPGTQVKTSTLFRHGLRSMDGIVAMVDQQSPHIEVKWTKVGY